MTLGVFQRQVGRYVELAGRPVSGDSVLSKRPCLTKYVGERLKKTLGVQIWPLHESNMKEIYRYREHLVSIHEALGLTPNTTKASKIPKAS